MAQGRREAKGCVHGDNDQTSAAVRIAARSQAPGSVLQGRGSSAPALPCPALGQSIPSEGNAGGAAPGLETRAAGQEQLRDHQSGCAWWRRHVTGLLPHPLFRPSREDGHPRHPAAPAPRVPQRRGAGDSAAVCSGVGVGKGRRRALCSRSACKCFPSRSSVPIHSWATQSLESLPCHPPPPPPGIPTAAVTRLAAASLALLDHCLSPSLGFLRG